MDFNQLTSSHNPAAIPSSTQGETALPSLQGHWPMMVGTIILNDSISPFLILLGEAKLKSLLSAAVF